MKPHPRIRKTVKWGGAAVTVLLVVVWAASGWWAVNWSGRHYSLIGLSGGHLDLLVQDTPSINQSAGWRVMSAPSTKSLHFDFDHLFVRFPGGGWTAVVSLLWAIPVPLAASVVAWRLDILARRRARVGRCPKCNYDRTGLAAGAVCPECATSPNSA